VLLAQHKAEAIREQQHKVQGAEKKWQECVMRMHQLWSQDLAVSDAMESTTAHEQTETIFMHGLPRSISHSVATPTIGSSTAAGGAGAAATWGRSNPAAHASYR
jgi:hypothetical protein